MWVWTDCKLTVVAVTNYKYNRGVLTVWGRFRVIAIVLTQKITWILGQYCSVTFALPSPLLPPPWSFSPHYGKHHGWVPEDLTPIWKACSLALHLVSLGLQRFQTPPWTKILKILATSTGWGRGEWRGCPCVPPKLIVGELLYRNFFILILFRKCHKDKPGVLSLFIIGK